MSIYRSVRVLQDSSKQFSYELTTSKLSDLPKNDVLIEVKYTALNHHDAVDFTGKNIKTPFTPGTDAAGVVVESKSPEFKAGDEVIVTGLGLGRDIPGGFGQYISVPAEMPIHIPIGMSTRHAAVLGSAGISAGLFLMELSAIATKGNVAVTLASFDYGAIASALLLKTGYVVTAFVDDPSTDTTYLNNMGISDIRNINVLKTPKSDKNEPSFNGIYDIVGGDVFSALLAYTNNDALMVLAGTMKDNDLVGATSYALLQQNVTISGVNPLTCPTKIKEKIWHNYTGDWKLSLDWLCTEISTEDLGEYLPSIINGTHKGRIVVNMQI